jgi:hypothetical protein
MTLPLQRIEDLFAPTGLGPFDPGFERSRDQPGIERVSGVIELERPKGTVGLTIELDEGADADGVQERAGTAVRRWCARKGSASRDDLRRTRRDGLRVLAWGFLAVLVLNGLANQLDESSDDVLQALSAGLQVAAWVTLWVPVNLLVYDRWYLRRDRDAADRMLGMEVRVVPAPPVSPGASAGGDAPR